MSQPLPRWQFVVLVTIGAAPGIVLSIIPYLLMSAYVRSFTATATPDSGFNVYTLGAVVCVLLAVAIALVALPTLFFRTVRPIGMAYIIGLLAGVAVDLLLLSMAQSAR